MMNYAIIGFGGLGKSHFHNLMQIEKERKDISLKAICNNDVKSVKNSVSINIGNISMDNIDFDKYNIYSDYKEMVKKEKLDFVFIALPTYMHAETAVYMLEHGIHVFVEKPMALSLSEADCMLKAAEKNKKKLMVGQSLRYAAEYAYLKELITNKTYGKPVKAEFSRKSPLPNWSFNNWMLNEEKSGGCIVDMHVHDVDMITWLFGTPDAVNAVSSNAMAKYESVYAIYKYPDMTVSAICDWGIPNAYKFSYSYAVTFEKAYAECKDGKVSLYTDDEVKPITLEQKNVLCMEEKEFISAVVDNAPIKTADVYSVYETMKLVFKEKELLSMSRSTSQ